MGSFITGTFFPELIASVYMTLGMIVLFLHTKIRGGVVLAIAILVVHLFIVFQVAPHFKLHQSPMKIDILLISIATGLSLGMWGRGSAVVVPTLRAFNDAVFVDFEECHAYKQILEDYAGKEFK